MRLHLRDRFGCLRNGWKMLAFVVLFAGFGAMARAIARAVLHLQLAPLTPGAIWLSAGCALAATAACARAEGVGLDSLGLRLDARWLGGLALGCACGVAMIGVTVLAIWALGGLAGFGAGDAGLAPWGWAWLFLAVAVKEELLFRGYLFRRAVDGMGRWPAQLLVAALFTAAHAGNPGAMGPLVWSSWADMVLASLLYGLLVLRTGSLAIPVGIHFGWNLTQSLLGFDVTGNATRGLWVPLTRGPDWLTGGVIGPEASPVCHATLAVACLLVAWRPGHGKRASLC